MMHRTWQMNGFHACGRHSKVLTFVALLGAQRGLTIATLGDFQKKDQQTIENLYRSKLLKKEKVLTFAEFFGGGSETDIEDMFEVEFFLSLVNGAYASSLPSLVAAADLDHGSPRILRRLEARFAAYPLKKRREVQPLLRMVFVDKHGDARKEHFSCDCEYV